MDDTTARAKSGSIYDQHRRAVFVYCLRRVPEQDAFDALNETFAIVWRRIDHAPALVPAGFEHEACIRNTAGWPLD